jgi:hypothetical protein
VLKLVIASLFAPLRSKTISNNNIAVWGSKRFSFASTKVGEMIHLSLKGTFIRQTNLESKIIISISFPIK